jgi:hypothetical protein
MRFVQVVLIFLILCSCENELSRIIVPNTGDPDIPDTAHPIPAEMHKLMEGVYRVADGYHKIGKDVVLKWNSGKLSIFSGKSAIYFILEGAYKDSTIYFEGYWRAATGSATGLATLKIEPQNGGIQLVQGIKPDSLLLTGFYGNGEDVPANKITLEYDYPVYKADRDFYIIGHRGGGRNIDRLPYSENSLGLIRFAEQLGQMLLKLM